MEVLELQTDYQNWHKKKQKIWIALQLLKKLNL